MDRDAVDRGFGFFGDEARTRSTVSVPTRPPRRRRLTSLPSLTARRPKVDSAILARRQYSAMSRRSVSLIRRLSGVTSVENLVCAKPRVNHNVAHWESGQLGGILPTSHPLASCLPLRLRCDGRRDQRRQPHRFRVNESGNRVASLAARDRQDVSVRRGEGGIPPFRGPRPFR
jgi:hypothetical protein